MNPATNDKALRGLLFALTPEGRAAAHRKCQEYLDEYVAKAKRDRERQSRQAMAQNEIEAIGVNENGTADY